MRIQHLVLFDVDSLVTTLIGGGAIFAGFGLIFDGLSHQRETANRRHELFNKLAEELAALETSQERNEDYLMFGAKYISLLDRIGTMALHNIIPNDVVRYFDNNFRAALALLDTEDFKKYKNDAIYLTDWCKYNGLIATEPLRSYEETEEISASVETDNSIYLINVLDENTSR